MIHELKIGKNYLKRLFEGKKKSEIRVNDRDYQVGDILKFYNSLRNVNVGDKDFYLLFEITHIHSGVGMAFNYVSLSVRMLEND